LRAPGRTRGFLCRERQFPQHPTAASSRTKSLSTNSSPRCRNKPTTSPKISPLLRTPALPNLVKVAPDLSFRSLTNSRTRRPAPQNRRHRRHQYPKNHSHHSRPRLRTIWHLQKIYSEAGGFNWLGLVPLAAPKSSATFTANPRPVAHHRTGGMFKSMPIMPGKKSSQALLSCALHRWSSEDPGAIRKMLMVAAELK